MRNEIVIALVCVALAPVVSGRTAHKADPLATPAAVPVAMIQTVTDYKLGEHAITVQSSPNTNPVKYLLARKVRYVDAETGKAVDPRKTHPGTRVRLESKTSGRHGVYRRVVILQPDRL